MAAHGWGKDSPLSDWLYSEGHRFDFFQAVKLLEMSRPSASPVGEGAEPAREPVRFKSAVGLAFPASDVAEVRRLAEEGRAAEVTVNFMGLAGALGPLQAPTTEQIIDRARSRDTAQRDFLDIFNHRLVSLLYRIRKVHRVGQDNRPPGSDRLSALVYSTFGMGTEGLRGRMIVKDRALLFYAGLLASGPRSFAGLCRIVSDYFGVPAGGVEFRGRWFALDEDQWTAIGAKGRNARLGEGALLGRRVWDQQGAFELRLGPLTLEEFEDFLPTGWGFGPLCDLARFYTGDELEFTVRLALKGEQAPPARLSAKRGARLGWTSWLRRPDSPGEDSPPSEVVGPFCRLDPGAWTKGDPEIVISPASLRAFPLDDIPPSEVVGPFCRLGRAVSPKGAVLKAPAARGYVRVPYFELPPDKLAELVSLMTPRRFDANRVVVRQGDDGDTMFVIRSGAVRITRRDSDGGETSLATLREGEYFGEMSLIAEGRRRNATAVTLRECVLLELSKPALDKFSNKYPRFAAAMRDYAETRK